MAFRNVWLICSFLLILAINFVSGASDVKIGPEIDLEPAGVSVYIDPDWILHDIGEFKAYSHMSLLHVQVLNNGDRAIMIEPHRGLNQVRHAASTEEDGVVIIGPIATKVLMEAPMKAFLEVSLADSTVWHDREQGYLVAQSMVSSYGKPLTGEPVTYKLNPGDSHHFIVTIAAKKKVSDLFALDLIVLRDDQPLVVATPIFVTVIDGKVHVGLDSYGEATVHIDFISEDIHL